MKFHKKIESSYTETEIYIKTNSEDIYEEILALFSKYIYLKTTSGSCKVKLSDIIYIEANKNYLEIYMKENEQIKTLKVRLTLYKLKDLLDDAFIQVSRSYIINYKYFDAVESDMIHGMVARVCGLKIPISRSYLTQIYAKLEKENL